MTLSLEPGGGGLSLGLPVAGRADEVTDRVDRLFARWDKDGSPGCALGVVRDGRLVYEKAFGLADLEQGRGEDVAATAHRGTGAGRLSRTGRRHRNDAGIVGEGKDDGGILLEQKWWRARQILLGSAQ